MKKTFEKYETLFCVILILLYLVINSICIQIFGVRNYQTTILNTIFSMFLIFLIIKLDRVSYYGLIPIKNVKKFLYFIPLILIVSTNLWNGINITYSTKEIVFYILTMINIGFIEEIIFRGFLFKMMEKDNVNMAIIICTITFGVGHVINLINGADLIPTLFQMCYAMSAGYLFVIVFYKSKSLVPCIISHSLINVFSIFNVDNIISLYITPIFLTIVPLLYAVYLNKVVE